MIEDYDAANADSLCRLRDAHSGVPESREMVEDVSQAQRLLNATGRFAEHRLGGYPIDAPGAAVMIRHEIPESDLKHFAALLEACRSYGERRLARHVESAVITSTPALAYREECGSIGHVVVLPDPQRRAWNIP